jgi:mono/diheme cytochrome c family protein
MHKYTKRLLWTLGGVATLAVGVAGVGSLLAAHKKDRQIPLPGAALDVDLAQGGIEQGGYLFRTRGCVDCHGGNGAGRVAIDNGGLLVIGPNITAGANSVVRDYGTRDWVRTLRHGVKPNGRPLLIMPSEDYSRLSDADTASLIRYVRQLPAVDGRAATVRLPLPVNLLYGYGVIRDAAQKIDHTLPPAPAVPATVSLAHGAYVANACIGCHGAQLSGGKVPGGPPDWPAAANLTPGKDSVMPRYRDAEAFGRMLRTGLRPDGGAINRAMPFESLREMNNTDVQALYAYLKSAPARDAGQH